MLPEPGSQISSWFPQTLIEPRTWYTLQLIDRISAVVKANASDSRHSTGIFKLFRLEFMVVLPAGHKLF
jgi:hypothetical protein